MFSGLVYGFIEMVSYWISLKLRLKKTRILNDNSNIEVFEYKGKKYDRKKLVELEVKKQLKFSKKSLEKGLQQCEKNLVKSKYPELDRITIEAMQNAIKENY